MRVVLLFILFVGSVLHAKISYAWSAAEAGTISMFDNARCLGMNDKGELLIEGKTRDIHGYTQTFFGITNIITGVTILPNLERRNPPRADSDVYWLTINNDVVIGVRSLQLDSYSFTPELVTWDRNNGIKKYSVNIQTPSYFASGNNNFHDPLKMADCRNSNKIVFTCNHRIFILNNNKVEELSPLLKNEAKKLGIDFFHANWRALSVNNNGAIFGMMECFNKHPNKDKSLPKGKKLFCWFDEKLKFVDIPEGIEYSADYYASSINNSNIISFVWNLNGIRQSWKWDIENDILQEITCPSGAVQESRNYYISTLLDDGTIVWRKAYGSSMFLLQHEETLHELDININPHMIDLTRYPGLSLSVEEYYFPIINNKKQFHVIGNWYNEAHPFFLIPTVFSN